MAFQNLSNLVFIDSAIEDLSVLIDGVSDNSEIILLDPEQEGISQITRVIRSFRNVASIHIISHGVPGALHLGTTELNTQALTRAADLLKEWSALANDAELLIYGCKVALGEVGRAFVQRFSELTGMAIAASTTLTGSTALGGNWELEMRTGSIKSPLAFRQEAIASYAHTLASDAPTLVIIDGGVEDHQALVDGVVEGSAVVVLDRDRDGIQQITELLEQYSQITSLHIVSHGAPGCLYLGNVELSLGTIDRYAAQLKTWVFPSLLLYGCNVAAGDAGAEFIDKLHCLTGSAIAASTTPTGNTARGGNWTLEVTTNTEVTAAIAFEPSVCQWQGILAATASYTGGGAVLSVNAKNIYSVDVQTGKATLFTTIPGTVGGVSTGTTNNSVASDPGNGLTYYTSNTGGSTALFAYDMINNVHFVVNSDLFTNFGLINGGVGLDSGGAAWDNGFYYIGIEGSSGSTGATGSDRIYKLAFNPASNGKTVTGATLVWQQPQATNDWGDFVVNGNTLYNFYGSTKFEIYDLTQPLGSAPTSSVSNAAYGQGTQDSGGNLYTLQGTTIRSVSNTGVLGTAINVTTNGTTVVASNTTDAGNFIPRTDVITGTVFSDKNANGTIEAGDTGVAGVTIALYDDKNNNGTIDAGEQLLATDTTDGAGTYQFNGVLPGSYIVQVTDSGGVLAGSTYTTGGATKTQSFNLVGQTAGNVNFGVDFPPTIAITSNKTALKAGDTATLTFTLSEASTNFVAADITVSGGTLSGFTGSGTTYTATFTPNASSTTNGVVSVASNKFSDASGKQNTDGADANNTVTMAVDTITPTIAVTSSKTALKAGDTATLTFTLSEASTDFIASDITVSGGTLSGFAGSGTTYTATFTPTAGSTTNGVISVASSKFSDAAGNQNADGADANNTVTMAVDTLTPTIAVTSNKTALKAGDTATLTFTLSEASTDFIASDITVSGGTLSGFAGSGTTYTATFTPNASSNTNGVISVASSKFSDAAGNPNADGADANNTVTMAVDTITPTIAITSSKTALKAGNTATLTFTLSEASTDFIASDITVSGGTLSGFAGSGTTYTATFTPNASSTTNGVISVASSKFSDAAGNPNADGADPDNTVTMAVDTITPTIAVTSNKTALKAGDTATLTFTLSETSTDFDATDIVVSGGTLSGFTGSGTTYTATFTPNASSTTNGVISVASNKFSDAAGNQNADGADANNTVTMAVDTITPTIAVTSSKTALKAGDTATLTFTLSETSTDFDATDIVVSGGTLSGFTGSGTTYTATFTPAAGSSTNGVISVASNKFSDAAGNQNADGADANNTVTMAVDTLTPTIAITSSKTALKAGNTATLTFTLSEASTDFIASDITVSGGTLSGFTGSGTTYTATFTPTAGSTTNGVISVASSKFSDAAGNQNADGADADNTATLTVDTLTPTIAITSSKTALKAGDTATLTFTLSEASTDFIESDITVSGGILSSFTGSGTTYTATFTPNTGSNTNGVISVASSKFSDAAGNQNADGADANNTVTMAVDTITPTIAVTSNKTALKAGDTAALTFTLSEAATDFIASDITVSGGTLSGFAGSGTTYTATFTPTASSTNNGVINVASSKFSDAAGNPNADGADPDNTVTMAIDTLAPTIVISPIATDDIINSLEDDSPVAIAGTTTGVEDGQIVTVLLNGKSYTATVTSNAWTLNISATDAQALNPSETVTANVSDLAGNPATPATRSITHDTSALTIAISPISTDDIINSLEDDSPVAIAGTTLGVEDGQIVTVLLNGKSYTASVTNNAWTLSVPALDAQALNSSETVTANVSDLAGNPATPATRLITHDTITPTIAITSDKPALKAGETATLTFTLSEASTDFVASDITVSGGTLSSFAGSGTTYTATFTPTAGSSTNGVISVASNKFTDAAGNQNADGADANNTATLTVDTITPTIAITSDKPALKAGETATLTFTLSEVSTDFDATDIVVSGGTLSGFAGSGTTYTATFTPTAGSSTNGVISVASSKFSDTAGNQNADGADADNTLSLTVDTLTPTIAITSDKPALKAGETATLTFTLSETSTDFDATDVVVSGGTLSGFAGSGTTYTATFTPMAGSSTNGVISVASNKFTDAAGNQNADGADADNTATLTVDTLTPTIAITSDKPALKAGETATLTFTLSEVSTDFDATDIVVSGGTLSGFTGSGTTYTATFTPTAGSSASGVISVASSKFSDAAGNQNTDGADADNTATLTVDTLTPTIAITSDKPALKAGETATLTFTLSEVSTDFDATDIVVSGGTLSGFTGSGTTYTATFTPTAGSSTNGVISVASNKFTDAAGNQNADGADADNTATLTVDTIIPTIAITSDKPALKAGETATLTFTLSEASTDFDATDIVVSGGTLSGFAGSGTTYTATFTPTAGSSTNGVISVASSKFSDAAGNQNADGADADNTATLTVDTLTPTIAITSDKPALKAGETATLTFTLSEVSTDFDATDIVVSGGTLSGFAGSGTTYTATFTPTAGSSTNGVISVASSKFTDAAGNQNADGADADNTLSLTVDTLTPTIAITSDKPALKAGETATLTFTLSETSTDFDATDIVVSGGTLSGFAGSGTTYTATFTPTAGSSTNGVISVASSKFTDAAGNQNADGADADNTATLTVDTITPTIAITSDKPALKAGETATLTFTLSEVSTDFDATDIVVSGGTLSGFAGSGTTYTATFTPTAGSSTNGVISVASSKFTDAAGNQNADGADADNTLSLTVDTLTPTIAITSDKPALKAGETATLTFTLSETSTDFDATDIVVSGGTLSGFAGSGTTYTATFTPTAGSSTNGVISVASSKFTDAAGNQNADGADADNTVTMAVDTLTPTIAITSDKPALKAGETATLTFTLSEVSTDFDATDIVVSGGTLSGFTGSGTTYTATFTPTAGSSTNGVISVASSKFSDAAGNQNADGADADNTLSLTVDTLTPTIAITSDKPALKAGETATLTFTLSETSTDFDATDVVVSGGTLSGFAGSGTTYTATFTPMAGSSTNGVISVASNKFTDAAGNQNADGADADNTATLTVDTLTPTIAITSDKPALKTGETATLTFTLSEVSTDFDATDIVVSGGTLSGFTGSGTTYTATFTPTAGSSASGVISVASSKFSDAAGNQNTDGADADNTATLTVDTLTPTIAITSNKPALKAGETATLTFTLSEVSTDFDATDIVVSGGTLSGFTGSGTTYTATFTPTAGSSTNGVISVASSKFSDAAGNQNADGADPDNTLSLTVDTLTPTIAITSDKPALKAGETATLTFTLSEVSTDFDATDIVVSGGTLSGFTGSGTTYTATFTPTAGSSASGVISVASSKFSDAAGNQNADGADADNTATLTVDTLTPTIAITSDKPALKAGETATLTFTLSEVSTDFDATDIVVSGGTLSGFTGSGTTYTATFTPTAGSSASGVISVASNKFSDAAGNQNADGADADNTATLTVDTLTPTIAITSDKPALKAGETATLTFTLSEASTDFDTTDIIVSGGTLSGFTGSGTTYTATFTPTAGSSTNGVINVASSKFSDAAGNQNADGADADNTLSLTVDTLTPTIAITSDKPALKAGETATLTFTLSEVSTDFDATDIVVSGGTLSGFAGSGTTYTATFTPTAGSSASGVISVASNKFSDAAGNQNTDGADADNTATLTVDTLTPTIAITSDKPALKAGETATLTFTLSEASTDFDTTDIIVSGGTLSGFTGSGTTYTATFTPTAGSSTNGVISVASNKFTDAAGNPNADGADADNTLSLTVDTLTPTIAITSDKPALKAGETATLTFTLSETSTDFDATDIVVSGGTLSGFAGSGTTYTATFTPTAGSSTNGVISVASNKFTDAAGNQNADGADADNTLSLTVDTLTPTIAITSDKPALKAGETATLTFTLSETSTDFDATDVVVSGGTLSGFAGSGTTYTATFTPTAGSSTNGVISVASNKFTDAAGNQNADGADADNTATLTVDTLTPTIAITSDKPALKAGETATLTFTLSEVSTDFDATDIVVSGGTLSGFAGSGTTYTATFTPTAGSSTNGVISVASSKFTDAAGNQNADGADSDNTLSLAVDTLTPTIAITSDKPALKAGETATLTFTLSEVSTDFDATDIVVSGGTLSGFTGSGTTYTATFTPTAGSSTNGVISVASSKFTDAAGNQNADGADADNTATLTVDTIIPTIAITSDKPALKAGETATLTFTLSEVSTDFDATDIVVSGGTLSGFAGSGTTYTATFTPTAGSSTNGVISVASSKFTDAAGNQNADGADADNTLSLTVDTLTPTIAITSDKPALKAGETATLTFTLSETSTDFDATDIVVSGGTLSGFAGSGTTYTATFTPTAGSSTNGVISVASSKFTDAAGNPNADGADADNTLSLTVDTLTPTIVVNPLTTNDSTPKLTGTVDDPTAIVKVTVNGLTYTATNNGDGTWTLADNAIAPALADGKYDVTAVATDAVGNIGTEATTQELTVDATAPIVSVNPLTTNDSTPKLTGTVDDPTTIVKVTVNGLTYTATNNGDGTWTLADNAIAPALADGKYDVTAVATDVVGNIGTEATTQELTVDATVPIVSVNTLTTNDSTPKLTGTVDDPTAIVKVTVKGLTYTATNNGDGTWTLADNAIAPALADGKYDVTAVATDAVGNIGTEATTQELTVDAKAPIVSVDPLTTKDSTPKLTGTVDDPTAVVRVTVNGLTYTATNNGDGTWTLADNAIAPALADGKYDVTAVATDALGNIGTDPTAKELSVDTKAPVVSVTPVTTNDSTPKLTGTVDDPTAVVKVTVNGTIYTATNNGDGTWTLPDNTITIPLANGTYDIAVTAADPLGNTGADTTTNELTINSAAPSVAITPLATKDSTPKLTGTVSDPTAVVKVTVNGTTYTATNNGDGTWTLPDNTIAPALADGKYNVTVSATDTLGNTGTDATTNELTIDATAPVVAVSPLTTNDSTPKLTGTVDDPTAIVKVTVNGTTYTATNNGDGTWTLPDNTITPGLANGTYDVTTVATDALGNASTDPTNKELTINVAAPVVTIAPLKTSDSTPKLTGTIDNPTASIVLTINGVNYTATNNGDGTWTLPDNTITTPLKDGTYDVQVTATDTLGNKGTDATTNELTIDQTPPVVAVTSLTTADTTPQITGTVDDPTAAVTVTINGTAYTAINNGDGTWTLPDNTITTPLANGTYDIKVAATDPLGNLGTDKTTNELTISPNTPPVVEPSSNPITRGTATLIGGLIGKDPGGSVVSYTIATLPDAAQGTLYLGNPSGNPGNGGTLITAGQSLTPAQVKMIYFQSSRTFSGAKFTYTATDNTGIVSTTPATVNLDFANIAPTVSDVNSGNSITPSSTVAVSGLSGQDVDGTIASYTIASLPESSKGALYLGSPDNGGVLVKAGQTLSPVDIGRLFFKASSTFDGSSFTYTTTDDVGATSTKLGTVTLGISRAIDPDEAGCSNDQGITRRVRGGRVRGKRSRRTLVGTPNRDRLMGRRSNDRLFGGKGIDTLLGGRGNDRLYGNQCNDLLKGGSGNDVLRGDSGQDKLIGNRGKDRLFGGSGNDVLTGGLGKDRLNGGSGNDKLSGGRANDRLKGGSGNDQLNGNRGRDRLFGGGGDDVLKGGLDNDKLKGGSGNDKLRGGQGNDWLGGNRGRDVLSGGGGNDSLKGGRDSDVLKGNLGNDRLDGGSGSDRLSGGRGNDRLKGRSGDDILKGNQGQDTLKGGRGNDLLLGNFNNDVLLGGSGDDVLVGGIGRDVLNGGQGNDRFVYRNAKEQGDRITDFQIGQDVIDLSKLFTKKEYTSAKPLQDYVKLAQTGSATVVQIDSNGKAAGGLQNLVTLENVTASRLSGSDFLA